MRTMTALNITLAATFAGISGNAYAVSSASTDLSLSANVPNTCYIASLAPTSMPSNVNGTSSVSTTSAAVTISYQNELADSNTAIALQKTVTYGLSAYCNYASHNVAIKSVQGGLVTANNQNSAGGFDHRINYSANFTWGSVTPTITTAGNPDNGSAEPAVDNQIAALPTNVNSTLTITTIAGTRPLVAGSYGDTLRLNLGASL